MPTPFAPAIETWLAAFASHNTRDAYRRCLVQLAQVLDGVPIESASSDDLLHAAERWRRSRPRHSARTWNQWVACVRSCFNALAASGLIDRSPASQMRTVPEPVVVRPTPTAEQVARIWAVLTSPAIWDAAAPESRPRIIRDRALFALLVCVGLRGNELVNLVVGSFNFEAQQIAVRSVAGRIQPKRWPASITVALHEQLTGRHTDEWAFTNLAGRPLSIEALNSLLEQLCDGAASPRFTALTFARYRRQELLHVLAIA